LRRKLSKFRQNLLKAIRRKNVMGGIQFPELPSERESATPPPTWESIDKLAEGEEGRRRSKRSGSSDMSSYLLLL
jgi:hypothetical protein